jgi:hypothetical protein
METLVGVFRCILPRRYWDDMRRGAVISIILTLSAGTIIGLKGLLAYVSGPAAQGARAAIAVGTAGGIAGGDQTAQMTAALQGMPLISALAFFLFTPTGWLADYLFLSALFRGVTLAVDNPWGDPLLTAIDHVVSGKRAQKRAQTEAEARELAEGPVVPDQILECRKFAGKEADFVVVSSRRKEGWTLATTVVASGVRLRLGDPLEKTLEGKLRTCYPLKVIRDLQVDRRIVHYKWPKDAPALEDPQAQQDVWEETLAAAQSGGETADATENLETETPPDK